MDSDHSPGCRDCLEPRRVVGGGINEASVGLKTYILVDDYDGTADHVRDVECSLWRRHCVANRSSGDD